MKVSSSSFTSFVLWIAVPLINAFYWYIISRHSFYDECHIANQQLMRSQQVLSKINPCNTSALLTDKEDEEALNNVNSCSLQMNGHFHDRRDVIVVDADEFDLHRTEYLAPMQYKHANTYIVKRSPPFVEGDSSAMKEEDISRRRLQLEPLRAPKYDKLPNWKHVDCDSMWQHYVAISKGVCFAVFRTDHKQPHSYTNAPPVIRFDDAIDDLGHDKETVKTLSKEILERYSYTFLPNEHNIPGLLRPIGLFRKIPQEKGRARLIEKNKPLLENFKSVNDDLQARLSQHGIKRGGDIVIMVINEGEVDLFMNFACSCQLHNISLSNVLVFSGTEEIVPMIESTGAIGLYHDGYSYVSRKASADYLDRVFVDMMWYKAFSIYLLLRLGVNILFQDTDLVWFKEPFSYIHDYIAATEQRSQQTHTHKEAFFSDDGQRSLRYAPFYANSGFYYLKSTPRSEYFSWSIMTAFDSVQRLGSHQNVLTTRLIEGIGLGASHVKILDIDDFPTGMLYHHDPRWMKQLYDKKVSPYSFHMCWTQGKPDKLIYLKKASMWYLSEQCSDLEAYTEKGRAFEQVVKLGGMKGLTRERRWAKMAGLCCKKKLEGKMP